MKKFIILIFAGIFSLQAFSQLNSSRESEFYPGEAIVQIRNGYSIEGIIKSFPENIQLKSIGELAPLMRIWHLSFDYSIISNEKMLEALMKHPGIRIAQNNHLVEERATMPNDPNTAANQWHHNNTGQTGGTVDADIDSDLAWDITTGGLTVQGDTIVVCIVEGGGALYTHPDIIGNFWRNYGEIPNNGQDDDGNGYIDDRDGWRVDNSTDNHGTGNHGTQCMGMIGAKGDNSVGVVGANWNVKIMLVSGFSTAESSVISAYNYPMKMRKLYNDSNGSDGAFVVATSASWGIDNADPNNYPLWCAMYDSLGKYGILNPGATTNNTANVDVVGDMPTACASDYMISVTRTSSTDSQAGGYGATTIDFGAPGINVYTPTGTNGYGTTTGTSFSCPLTAGVIGLLYSVPCNSFISLAKADPQAAADQVRLALMNGVDLTTAMNGISVTGGRLNAFNSINELLNNCSTSGCITPYALSATGMTDTDVTLSWDNGGGTDFIFYIREVGSPNWDSISYSGTSIFIDTLNGCTDYEFMVRGVCPPSDTSGYYTVYTFSMDGCCTAPTGVSAAVNSNSSATISFGTILAADSYNVYYKPSSSNIWTLANTVNSPFLISGLDSCTSYDVQIQSICDLDSSNITSTISFTTTGCGFCESNAYCTAAGNISADEWISNVTFASIDYDSGNDGGYEFTMASTDVFVGQTYPISLSPGFPSGNSYNERFVVWIDYNRDGLLDNATEEVYDSNTAGPNTVTGNVTIPAGVNPGITRMRVAMKYINGTATAPASCGMFGYGEVEDYCVNLIDTTTLDGVNTNEGTVIYQVYPNPANENIIFDIINFKEFNSEKNLVIINSLGEMVFQKKLTNSLNIIDTEKLPSGIYYYNLNLNETSRQGKFVIQR